MQPSEFSLIKEPQTLIYAKNEPLPIFFIGAYSRKDRLRKAAPPRPNYALRPPLSLEDAHFSYACLHRAHQIRVFIVPDTLFCRGLIICSVDGQRALGQCRVGIDPVKELINPLRFCFKNTTYWQADLERELSCVQVECCSSVKNHVHEDMGWTCCRMSGDLIFWFTEEETKLEHLDIVRE